MALVRTLLILLFATSSGWASLVAYWPLDGHLHDRAPAGEKEDQGSIRGESAFGNGFLGKGIKLDGRGSVVIPHSPDLKAAGKSLTVSTWFQVSRWDHTRRFHTVVSKGVGNRFSLHRFCYDHNMMAWAGGIQEDLADVGGGVVNDGEWHHAVGVTRAGKESFLLVDGILVNSGGPETANLGDSGRPLMIGWNPEDGSRGWLGSIDEVGIFSEALALEEAQALHQLAVEPQLGYDLPTIDRMIVFHRQRSANVLTVGEHFWKYASRNPDDKSVFVRLSSSGSGLSMTTRPTTVHYQGAHRFLVKGQSTILSWKLSNDTTSVSLSPGPKRKLPLEGTLEVTPESTTEYQLIATNEHGKIQRSVTVHVDYPFATPVLSEFMADSAGELLDEDGETSDWLELFNPGPQVASTNDLFLTDDRKKPRQWALPFFLMEPGEHRIVFASGKNRRRKSGPLHTNFKLSAKGEHLALNHSSGKSLSHFGLRYPRQVSGISYGRDKQGRTGSLSHPTPGSTNSPVVSGQTEGVQFSVKRGVRVKDFSLTLSTATADARIRYTTDGSLPTSTHGHDYVKPLVIFKTTVLRAVAIREGWRPSEITTQSYLFLNDTVDQSDQPEGFPPSWETFPADYEMDPRITENPDNKEDLRKGLRELPALSISLPNNDLFGAERGIYSFPLNSGKLWERASSVELICNDDEAGFHIDCGLRIHGGYGRNRRWPKHNFRLLFKRKYGAGKLNYPLYQKQDPKAATSFDTLILRAGFNNSWQIGNEGSQYLRDEFSRRTQLAMGQPASHGRFVHLYLNGLYWGIYTLVERPSAPFAASYQGGDREDYDALNSGKAVDGTTDDWYRLHGLARESSPDDVVSALESSVDLDNLIDYMLLNFHGGNADWDGHNWYAARRKKDGFGFQFYSWDAERTLEDVRRDKTDVNYFGNPSHFFSQLLRSEDFRRRVRARSLLHFFDDGALTAEKCRERYASMAAEIENAIVAECARWGDLHREEPFTREEFWIPERNRLLDEFFPQRTRIVLEQLNRRGDLGFIERPRVTADDNQVTLAAGGGTVYYTIDGSDPRGEDGNPHPSAKTFDGKMTTQVILPRGSIWKYLDDGSNQKERWRQAEFDDQNWKSGKARLGYGGDGEVTTLSFGGNPQEKHITTYFRRHLEIPSDAPYDLVQFLTSRDDGSILYLNGREIARSNLPRRPVHFQTTASRSHDDHSFHPSWFGANLLRPGSHQLAVEVHQASPTSSDMGFDLECRLQRFARKEIKVPSGTTFKARTIRLGSWSPLQRVEVSP